MFCPNLSDPKIKEQFEKLQSLHPDFAYYLWDKYQGEVPAKYYQLSSTQIKPGVEELFNENSELASVGTSEQYSAYLDTIFPDSKVKDILYHGTPDGRFDSFDLSRVGTNTKTNTKGIYFTDSKKTADFYAEGSIDFSQFESYEEYQSVKTAKVFPVILNAKNLKLVDDPQEQEKQGDAVLRTKNKLSDKGFVGELDYAHQYIVFDLNQIHILGNKQDIEGFKKFVASQTSPITMESRVMSPEKVAERIITEDIKKEKVKSLVRDLYDNPDYQGLTPEKKAKFISSEIFKREILPLQRRKSVTVESNGDIIFTPTKKTTSANPYLNSKNNFQGYAYSVANNLNRNYFTTSAPVAAKLTELPDGRIKLELASNNKYFSNLVRFIDEVQQEYISAEIEAIEQAEFLAKDYADLVDKERSANEKIIDGEVMPFDGSLLDSRLGVIYKTANPQYEKYSKVLNFLSTKFKGASWTWNVNLDQAARVNILTGEIEFNPYMMQEDTPWHEFGHLLVRSIKQNNPELFQELKDEVKKLHEEDPTNSAYAFVKELYPEYGLSEAFWEEAITTELGRQAALTNAERESLTLFDKIKNFFKSLFGIDVNENTSMSQLVDSLLSKEEVEVINDYYSPEVVQVMYQRVIPPGMENSMDGVLKEEFNRDENGQFLSFSERVQKLASQIEEKDFKQILNSNKFIGTPNNLLNNSINQLKRIQQYVKKEEAAAAFIELTDYVQTTNMYLKLVEQRLRKVEDDETFDPKKKLASLHFAKKQVAAFEGQMAQIEALLNKEATRSIKAVTPEQQKTRSDNGLLYQLAAIKGTISAIKDSHNTRIIEPVAEELWKSLEAGNKQLAEQFDREIEKLQKGKSSNKDKLVKEKQAEKERSVLTKEKLIQLLQAKDNLAAYAAESAFSSKNPSVQIIAQYIREGIAEVNSMQLESRNKLQTIQNEIAKDYGDVAGAVVDLRKVYNPYYREVDYVEVKGDTLVTKKVLALNTKTKTPELQNKITTLKYNLEKATTIEDRKAIQDEIDEFYEKYTERPFTDEYYEIQNKLPLRIRKQRQEIYQEIAEARQLLDTSLAGDEKGTTQVVVERIQSLNRQLDDMERLYDSNGQKKTGEELKDAEAIIEWKKIKKAKNSISYELTETSKAAFAAEYSRRFNILKIALEQATTEEERIEAQNDFDAWSSINVRTTFKQEFYDRRQEVISEISYLLQSRNVPGLDTLYDELFNILKGNRDSSGVYIPTNYSKELLKKSKDIEEQIEDIKNFAKENSPLDDDTRQQLKALMEELQKLQSTSVSSYYKETKDGILAQIRTQVALENPEVDESELNRLVYRAYLQSDWYKDNHIIKKRYNPDLKTVEDVAEPIFVWRITHPNNPDYIERTQPSFNWYSAKVNPDFINPKYKSGSVQFKEQSSGTYVNENYDKLSPKKKELLEKLREFYYEQQDTLYASDKLGDVIPGLRSSAGENFIDSVRFRRNPLGKTIKTIKAWWVGDTTAIVDEAESYGRQEDELSMVTEDTSNTRGIRKLMMKHSNPLDISEQSYNIMAAIASYSEASAEFKALRNLQSFVLSAEEVLPDSEDKKKIISKTIDRVFFGKTLAGGNIKGPLGGFVKGLNVLGRAVMGAAGSKVIKFNALSIVPNYTTGIKNNFANARSHGLSQAEMGKAFFEANRASKDWVLSHSTYGNKTLRIQLLDLFAAEQKEYFRQGTTITNTGLRKYGQVFELINTMRDLTEFLISAQNAYAYLSKYSVTQIGTGKQILLKDAFTLKDGTITQRDDVEIPEGLIELVRSKIYLANRRSQGIYDNLSQPELSTNMLFRFVLFLKKWVTSDLKASFGSETIHYGAGLKTEGSWRAFGSFVRDASLNYKGNFIAAYNESSEARKGGLQRTGINLAVFLALTNALKALVKFTECEEDGEADVMDYLCYFMKRITNEAEGISTAWGINELVFTYYKEQANGVSVADKLFGQITSPVTILRRLQTDEEFRTLDPYYRYDKSKISWDKTHPGLAGQPGLMVLGYELLGLRGVMLDPKAMEFNNRRFNDYSPKTYTKELATRYNKNYEGLEIMKQRTPAYQTRRQFNKQYNKLKEQAKRAIESNNQEKFEEYRQKATILRENYISRLQEIRERNNEFEEIKLPYLPFIDNREGLDLAAGEISETDFE